MPWPRRVSIAQSLEYFHERCEPQVVHGDEKALNVLLDGTMSAKLCDFRSARMGFSAVIRPRASAHTILGSPGYVCLHYIRSGVLTTKTDVYSFGVLLLELLMGIEAFCPMEGRLLTAVFAPRRPLEREDRERLRHHRGLAETSYWGGATGVVVDVRVKLRPPREQTGVVVLEDNNGGGAVSTRQRQVQVELALH